MHTSWHDFIQMHSGKGHTMTELAKLYKKKHSGAPRKEQKMKRLLKDYEERAGKAKRKSTKKRASKKSKGGPCRDPATGRYESCSL
ncbi:hypothetical protein D1R32_gp350 [Tunisvirus fontaine2]|uniref:Uncharacterized protein n=1 Tax=Tunisvirus fontaine2 TaxID=1421067 RepID=V9SH18_9VIRU|nr:hypothetical protein D1R32_gp350 [Tunisvirus fontaine2]AHC55067.1 hypothetical protein TNS_ORF349 [Tunisvirus fontaine2]